MEFKSELARFGLRISRLDFRIRIILMHEHANHGDIWNLLVQKLQLLWPQLYVQRGCARGVATRPIQAGNQSDLNWVAPHLKDYRNCRGCCLCRKRCSITTCGNYGHLATNEIGGQRWQSIVLAFRSAVP
jgi:hypothetical protein